MTTTLCVVEGCDKVLSRLLKSGRISLWSMEILLDVFESLDKSWKIKLSSLKNLMMCLAFSWNKNSKKFQNIEIWGDKNLFNLVIASQTV